MAEAIERMLLLKYIDDTGSELLPNNSQSELRRTVNHFVTNRDKESNVDELCCSMLMEKCGGADNKLDAKKNFDLSSLPPSEVCLRKHVKRVNYQVAIWKRGHDQNPEIPSPTDDNGWVMVNGRI